MIKQVEDIYLKRIIKQYEDRYNGICKIQFPLKFRRLQISVNIYDNEYNRLFQITKEKKGFKFKINENYLDKKFVKKLKFKQNNNIYSDQETCLVVAFNTVFRFIEIKEKEYINNVFELYPVLRTCTEGEISDY